MRRNEPTRNAELTTLRADVDRVNERLVALLQQRARIVARIARLKRRAGIAIADPRREQAMLRTALAAAGSGLPRASLARILRLVFAESRRFAVRTATSLRAPGRPE